jgi:hypothetical protein
MKTLKQFTKWWNKTGKERKKKEETTTSSLSDYKKSIREREDQEHKRLEKWREELKQNMSNNYTYSNSIGHLPGNMTITNSIYSDVTVQDYTTLKTAALEIDGRDILKELDEMRDALLLLKRDVDMEAKYPRLRELKDEYERALEKYKTFETIKESK